MLVIYLNLPVHNRIFPLVKNFTVSDTFLDTPQINMVGRPPQYQNISLKFFQAIHEVLCSRSTQSHCRIISQIFCRIRVALFCNQRALIGLVEHRELDRKHKQS